MKFTLGESEEEDISGRRRRGRGLVVNENTDFSTFQWKVGLIFPNIDAFKREVTKFSITQGMNLSFVINNKKWAAKTWHEVFDKLPIKIVCIGDSRRAYFVVKLVDGEHSCNRNIDANKQMKST